MTSDSSPHRPARLMNLFLGSLAAELLTSPRDLRIGRSRAWNGVQLQPLAPAEGTHQLPETASMAIKVMLPP